MKFSVLLLCVSVVLNSAVDMVVCNSLLFGMFAMLFLDMVLHVYMPFMMEIKIFSMRCSCCASM